MNRDTLLGRDVLAGAVFIGLGLFTIVHSTSYPIGTLTEMGPGYFPIILGGMMILFGISMALSAVVTRSDPRVARPQLRGVLAICGSAVCFALLLEPIGLPTTVFCASLIACGARSGFLRPSNFVLCAFLALLCTVVFVDVLNISIRLWPAWLQGY